MYKVQLKGEIRSNGELIIDVQQLKDKISLMQPGHVIVSIEQLGQITIEDYQRKYFAIRDQIVADTGNDRNTVHTQIKNEVLIEVVRDTLYLNMKAIDLLTKVSDGDAEVLRFYIKNHLSTTWLNEAGWKEFIERVRIWAMTGLNIHV